MRHHQVIWIIGAAGQLGRSMQDVEPSWASDVQVLYTDKELDICDLNSIESFVKDHQVTHIVNCAAYTQVDKAEEEEEAAHRLNALAVENIAQCCRKYQIFPIQISTDYVYPGTHNLPYKEGDFCDPQSVYGRTKLGGERAILQLKRGVIVRTSWLYSRYGQNFVFTMQRLGKEREELQVVFDQVGSPTFAPDLAEAIWRILFEEARVQAGVEIFNYSNEGVCSWFDFAHAIMGLSNIACKVRPIGSDAYPQKAKRPTYSVMDKTKVKTFYELDIPHWRESLERMINQ